MMLFNTFLFIYKNGKEKISRFGLPSDEYFTLPTSIAPENHIFYTYGHSRVKIGGVVCVFMHFLVLWSL